MGPGHSLRRVGRVVACLAVCASASVAQGVQPPAAAADAAAPQSIHDEAFGVTVTDYLTLDAIDFRPSTTTGQYSIDPGSHWLTNIAGPSLFLAPVRLPSGALITGVEFAGCNFLAGDVIAVGLARALDPMGSAELMATVTVDNEPTCTFWVTEDITSPTVNNYLYSYWVAVQFGQDVIFPPHSSNLRLRAVRIWWQRQVTPLDGTANFSDVVLSNPYRRWVEAATAAGILGPCASGRFCPDNPVTRAQLALALAKALGLQYPPVP